MHVVRADSTVHLQAAAAPNPQQVGFKIRLAELDALSAMLARSAPHQAPHCAMLVLPVAMPTLPAPLRTRATVCVRADFPGCGVTEAGRATSVRLGV